MSQRATKARRNTTAVDEFESVRAKIRNQGNTALGLKRFRLEQHPARIYRLAGMFARHPAYRGLALPTPFPKKASELPKQGFHNIGAFLSEFAWLASLVKAYSSEIKSFVQLRDRVDLAFLHGEIGALESLLTQAESLFGQSAWLVENRIGLFDLVGAPASKSRYTQAIWQPENPALYNYIISWYVYRTGAGVSAGEVERLMEEMAKQPSPIADLVFALNGRYPQIDQNGAAEMLNYSDVLPLVDRYQVFLVTLQCLFASATLESWAEEHLRSILADLCEHLPDLQLHRIARAFGADIEIDLDHHVLALQNDYINGQHAEIAAAFGSQSSSPIEVLEIFLRSRMMLRSSEEQPSTEIESKSPFHDIKADLGAILDFSEEGVEARARLQKIILSSCNATWAASLRLILERQSHDERILEPTHVQTVLGLRSTVEHAALVLTLPAGPARERAIQRNLLNHPRSLNVELLARLCDLSQTTAPENGSGVDDAIFLLRRRQVAEAIQKLEEQSTRSGPRNIQLEALKLQANAYWQNRQIPQMADITATLLVRSGFFGAILPIRELVTELLLWHDQPLSSSPTRGKLSVAIVFDVFSRLFSSQYDAEKADAFKDVLRANGVRKASELDQVLDRFAVPELVYFLRFVGVPDVLDQSLALETSRAVEDERVAILLLISELTAGKAPAAIKDELREIRTKQVVRDTTLRLDQSKIYVNVEGIRRSIDVTMRDDWNRYRLMNEGLEQTLLDILEQVRSEKTDPVRTIIITNPTERFAILKRMIYTLRDEFTMNKEFGLNSNLSTNIRHGYVEREIRGPLLARNLITNKDTDKGSYLQNKFWLERLDEADISARQRLSDLLDRFSGKIDDQIDRLNRQLLRIQSEATPEGLFKYTLSDSVIMAGDATTWSSKESFDEFVDAVFAVFWDGTQRNLVQVRFALTTSVLSGLIECLTNFSQDLTAEGLGEALPDLDHAITLVQTEMRAAIDRVASWFTLSSNHEYQDFDLAIAFQAGMNTVKTYFRNLSISENYQSDREIVMNGWCLPIFVRLFFLILDNAATHGARNRSTLRISMTVEVRDGYLFIKATNDLPEDHDRTELRKRVDEINRDYGQARAMELLSEEGGSGYPKIWKLLRTDLRRDHDLYVAAADNEFSVEILLPTGGILNEASDSRG
ncbi:hypothetical protein [Rhizobium mesosinicum]|uniref:ATP-binding protein n=1 Tax=Rhizobium mesosinicum TaxID=335017 RepID=A0ABS7GM86_9HYPH|nr:hypothetical protein [Rhizobium mesosinicum]MBW9051089.1 hypothetical protein [Rhizobium mesosinicum]